jgi:hypothetical protein
MAEIVQSLPKQVRKSSTKYPTEWLDGQTRKLVAGQDFTCKPASLITALYAFASKHGCKATCRFVASEDAVYVVAAKLPTEEVKKAE